MIKVIAGNKFANAQPLSPIDLIYKDIYSIIALVYDYELKEEDIFDGLVKMLDINPYVGGRLSDVKESCPLIDGSNKGVIFESCRYDTFIPEYSAANPIKLDQDAEKYLFKCPVDNMDEHTPFIQIKLSKYKNGCILCISFSHALCDASIFSFLRDWSRTCRNVAVSDPENDRNLISEIYGKYIEKQKTVDVGSPGFDICMSKNKKSGFGTFELEGSYIDESYNSLINDSGNQEFFSRQDFLTAYILQNIFACIDSKNTDYSVGVIRDMRKLMELPASYFGNAVAIIDMIVKDEVVRGEPLRSMAKKIRKSINDFSLDNALGDIRKTVEYKQKNTGNDTKQDTYFDNKIVTNNYTNLPIYDVDFGDGPPVWAESLTAIVSPELTSARSVIIWPSSSKDAGVVFHVILPLDELPKLQARLSVKGCIGEF